MDKRVLLALFIVGVAFGVNVTMDMPESVAVDQEAGTFVTIKGDAEQFDFAVLLPEGWYIKEWAVESYDKDWVKFEVVSMQAQGKTFEVAHWKFSKKIVGYAKLYFVFVPKEAGIHKISGFWITPTEFGKVEDTIEVIKPVCGNGICEVGESTLNCPQDCGIGRGLFAISVIVLIVVAFFVWFVIKKVKE